MLAALIDVQKQVDMGLSAMNKVANSREYIMATQFLGMFVFAVILVKVFRKLL